MVSVYSMSSQDLRKAHKQSISARTELTERIKEGSISIEYRVVHLVKNNLLLTLKLQLHFSMRSLSCGGTFNWMSTNCIPPPCKSMELLKKIRLSEAEGISGRGRRLILFRAEIEPEIDS